MVEKITYNGCPECKKFLLSSELFCGSCGKKGERIAADIICPECRTIRIAKYCSRCGTKTEKQ